jgi:ureidoacrylate peracid hydrolase
MNATVKDAAVGGAAAEGLADWIKPSRTALVIIDIQVDFALPEGVLGQAGLDMAVVAPAVAKAAELADLARKAGTPVVFVGLQTQAALDSPAWKERMRRRGSNPDEESAVCRAGERGAEFVGPTPLPGELVIGKIRYSSFFDTPLHAGLKALGVDTLLVCGLTTECCVDCTVRDAYHLDYQVYIATDACGAYETEVHEAALKNLELNCATLVTTDEVATAWSESVSHG